LSFGIQGIVLNPNHDNDYTFRFTARALWKTSRYYAGRIFLVRYLGFLLPLAALMARNRRTWLGLAAMVLFFFPLLFLPGRLFSAYCYVPFIGLAIGAAGVVEEAYSLPALAAVALFFLAWIPIDIHALRVQRRATLGKDAD